MISIALKGLEKIVNAYLRLDPDSLERLTRLNNKIIKIDIMDWHYSFYIRPSSEGMEFKPHSENEPDTTISGTLFGLFKAGCGKADNVAIFQNNLSISGNVEVGETLRDILGQMDIDWEEHLSKIVGDIAAHRISTGIEKTRSIARHTVDTLKNNIKDYLQIESAHFPIPSDVEAFISEVTNLQHDVDRMEQRINKLLAKRAHS